MLKYNHYSNVNEEDFIDCFVNSKVISYGKIFFLIGFKGGGFYFQEVVVSRH